MNYTNREIDDRITNSISNRNIRQGSYSIQPLISKPEQLVSNDLTRSELNDLTRLYSESYIFEKIPIPQKFNDFLNLPISEIRSIQKNNFRNRNAHSDMFTDLMVNPSYDHFARIYKENSDLADFSSKSIKQIYNEKIKEQLKTSGDSDLKIDFDIGAHYFINLRPKIKRIIQPPVRNESNMFVNGSSIFHVKVPNVDGFLGKILTENSNLTTESEINKPVVETDPLINIINSINSNSLLHPIKKNIDQSSSSNYETVKNVTSNYKSDKTLNNESNSLMIEENIIEPIHLRLLSNNFDKDFDKDFNHKYSKVGSDFLSEQNTLDEPIHKKLLFKNSQPNISVISSTSQEKKEILATEPQLSSNLKGKSIENKNSYSSRINRPNSHLSEMNHPNSRQRQLPTHNNNNYIPTVETSIPEVITNFNTGSSNGQGHTSIETNLSNYNSIPPYRLNIGVMSDFGLFQNRLGIITSPTLGHPQSAGFDKYNEFMCMIEKRAKDIYDSARTR